MSDGGRVPQVSGWVPQVSPPLRDLGNGPLPPPS